MTSHQPLPLPASPLPNGGRRGLLIVLPGGLGDLVQAREVLEGLASRVAQPVDLLTGDSLAAYADGWGVFRAVLAMPAYDFYHGSALKRLWVILGLVRAIRRRRYSNCLICKAHPLYAFMVFLAGVPNRIGFSRGSGRWLTIAVPLRGDVHRVDRLRAIAAIAAGAELGPPATRPYVSGRQGDNLKIGIAPGGARNVKEEMPDRRWPAGNYGKVARALSTQWPTATFVLLGGSSDGRECAEVMAALPAGQATNLCGALRLGELEGTIAELDVFITHDSGLLHVAGRTGCGLVAIFGPTDPRVAAPRGAGIRALWNPGGPTPCHDEVFGVVNCTHTPPCIARVTVKDVLDAVEELVDDRRYPSGKPTR